MKGRLLVAFFVVAGMAGAGCLLITGSTSGYTEAGPEGGCEAASDCVGDAGGVCCLSLTAGAACQRGPCGSSAIQLCTDSGECSDDASCLSQSCTYAGSSYEVRTCGEVPPSFPITCTTSK
jgi:hypothetical protein